MKLILRVVFISLILSVPLFSKEAPHLVLYFDINKTLIASDKAGNKSIEDVLNELLAEKYESSFEEPVKNRRHFIDQLREHSHPLYGAVLQDYQAALNALNAAEGMVFHSFYRLLDYLDQQQVSYSVILRSFGEEVLDVKEEIEAVHHTFFSHTGYFRKGSLYLRGSESLDDPMTIYELLRDSGHVAIRDDWNYWSEHHLAAQQSKPFYIDKDDLQTLPIFFDDNIGLDNEANIIGPLDVTTNEPIPVKKLIDSGQAVQVDTLKAILDPDYYKNHVEKAIQRHAQ